MIFNDTKVRKARIYGSNSASGGRAEFLFLHRNAGGDWVCAAKKIRKKRIGQLWDFPGGIRGCITSRPENELITLKLDPVPDEQWFETYGHVPLPPYMQRSDKAEDSERYQTIYARNIGSAAAPTAGLHFTEDILKTLADNGVETAWITLRIGMGTYAPVRVPEITDHTMHSEDYFIAPESSKAIEKALREGRRILAVGTTSLRCLESAWKDGRVPPGRGSTDIFIYPGYQFKAVDALFTNFHTPESTLLMLVSAFAGRERILDAYKQAIEMQYRFFSYGDAMIIL